LRLGGRHTSRGNAEYIYRNVDGGRVGITGDALTPIGPPTYVCSGGIQGRFARQLDTMLDDNNTDRNGSRDC
jgi:hypothetical protein